MGKRVTILGAGNAGHATAFDISLNGGEVMLFEHPNFAKSLDGIRQKGGIEAVPSLPTEEGSSPAALSGFAKISGLTTDPKEAMDFADIVVMLVPGFAQIPIFQMVMPHVRDGQIFVILPGNFASLIFKKMMKDAGMNRKVTFVEGSSIPYAVRVIGPGRIYMLGKKASFSIGSLPSSEIKRVIETLQGVLLLHLLPLKNVLEAGMSNANMIIHTPTATLNMGLAESTGGKGQFYRDGVSPAVSKVLEAMDKERLAIGRVYDLNLMTFVETVNDFYSLDMKDIRDFVVRTPIHNNVPDDFPKSPKERYISEDCPFVCVPVYALGQLAGVPCPVTGSIITIDGIYNDTDYLKEGRNLEKLGLSGMTVKDVLDYVK